MPIFPEPVSRSYRVAMTPPSLDDPEADTGRLVKALAEEACGSDITFDYSVLCSLSNVLRENEWRVNAVLYNHECIAVLPEETSLLGLAVDDIGTNTEICLANNGSFYSLSTASGPAFEGAHIRYGMRAARGAIERFQIIDGKNKVQTIENAPATGMCGSGILE